MANIVETYKKSSLQEQHDFLELLRRSGFLGTGAVGGTIDLTGIDLSDYAEVGHSHDASAIISGTIDPDRLPLTGNIDGGVPDSVYYPIEAIDGGTP